MDLVDGTDFVDGNALAGPLREIFATDVTVAVGRCAGCGRVGAVATLRVYDRGPGLVARCPDVHFVWIMGADNLRSFHRWQRWRGIANLVPIAVVDRVGPSLYARAGTAGQALARFRIREDAARSLPRRE